MPSASQLSISIPPTIWSRNIGILTAIGHFVKAFGSGVHSFHCIIVNVFGDPSATTVNFLLNLPCSLLFSEVES